MVYLSRSTVYGRPNSQCLRIYIKSCSGPHPYPQTHQLVNAGKYSLSMMAVVVGLSFGYNTAFWTLLVVGTLYSVRLYSDTLYSLSACLCLSVRPVLPSILYTNGTLHTVSPHPPIPPTPTNPPPPSFPSPLPSGYGTW
jgi:hypothetical protein